MSALKALVLLLALPATVHAQQCPAGLAGMPNCLPPTHPSFPHSSGKANIPLVIWEDRAAAVAMGKSASGFTAVDSMGTIKKAERAALEGCNRKKGRECKVVMSYINSCAALAWGREFRTGAYGPTVEEAGRIAIARCSEKTEECEVLYSACSLPVQVR